MTLSLILIVLALIALGLASLNTPSRFNLVAVGLFFWLLTNVLVGVSPVFLR